MRPIYAKTSFFKLDWFGVSNKAESLTWNLNIYNKIQFQLHCHHNIIFPYFLKHHHFGKLSFSFYLDLNVQVYSCLQSGEETTQSQIAGITKNIINLYELGKIHMKINKLLASLTFYHHDAAILLMEVSIMDFPYIT